MFQERVEAKDRGHMRIHDYLLWRSLVTMAVWVDISSVPVPYPKGRLRERVVSCIIMFVAKLLLWLLTKKFRGNQVSVLAGNE